MPPRIPTTFEEYRAALITGSFLVITQSFFIFFPPRGSDLIMLGLPGPVARPEPIYTGVPSRHPRIKDNFEKDEKKKKRRKRRREGGRFNFSGVIKQRRNGGNPEDGPRTDSVCGNYRRRTHPILETA